MTLKDLLDLYEKLETRANAYWNFWAVVLLGLGGWVFSGKFTVTQCDAPFVVVTLAAFFACNLGVLCIVTRLLKGVSAEIVEVAGQAGLKANGFETALNSLVSKYRMHATIALHLVVDVAAIYLVWIKSQPCPPGT